MIDGTIKVFTEPCEFAQAKIRTMYVGDTAVTASAAELNILDGVTATYAEINRLDRAAAIGIAEASKAVVLDAAKHLDEVNTASLKLGATGATVAVTATAAELNILAGVTATAAELNLNDNQLATATIAVGAEAANVIKATIQLKDAAGADMAIINAITAYLSSDAAGKDLATDAPDVVAIAADGCLLKSGGDSLVHYTLISEADGDIDINFTHVGVMTCYLNLVMPNAKVVTSGAITFDAAT